MKVQASGSAKFALVFFLLMLIIPLAHIHALAGDSPISDAEKYAWPENTGWLNFKPSHGGVMVHDDHLSGYAWCESIGWVKLGSDGGGPYYNTTAGNWGVNREAGGGLSGYAWSESAGWINFNSSHSHVTIDAAGWFDGYAWSESAGWVRFRNAAKGYGVMTLLSEATYSLTVQKDGAGTGTVTSSPAGIDCGGDCSDVFREGNTVILTAAPDPGIGFDGWTGADCPGNGDCAVLMDRAYTITATFNDDTDGDGISDVVENAGPNQGDGNYDGVQDFQQAHVATFLDASPVGYWCTLVSEDQARLVEVKAQPAPDAGSLPEGLSCNHGAFGFKVMDLTPGASTRVALGFHEAFPDISSYYMCGPTPDNPGDHWYDFFYNETTGARIESVSEGTVILMSFVDGGRGDGDLTVNGEISDPGAPISPSGGGTGGGGSCFISSGD